MYPGAHKNFAVHAGKSVLQPIDRPARNLAIERDEILNPVIGGPALWRPAKPRAKVQPIKTDDQLAGMKLGGPVSLAQFPREYYMGEGL